MGKVPTRQKGKYRISTLHALIYIFLILSPLYFFESGGLQIGDIFLILAFGIFLIASKGTKIPLKVIQENKEYVFFLVFVVVINLCYFILYSDGMFIKSSLYYVFNLFAILIFSFLFKSESFQKKILIIMRSNIIIQLLIYLTKFGRWYGKSRYMGTFNNPNQFAFNILISYSFVFLLSNKFNKKVTLCTFITLYLIIVSASTGMFLGFGLLIVLQFFNLKKLKIILRKKKYLFIVAVVAILLALFTLTLELGIKERIISQLSDARIVQRIEGKIVKKQAGLLQERGYDRIYHYPQYILFGSGEGYYDRWVNAYHQRELHATLPSVLFCYGIIPLIILISWMYKKIKKLPFDLLIVYIAILIESFTILSTRRTLFWMLFVLAPYLKKESRSDVKNKSFY